MKTNHRIQTKNPETEIRPGSILIAKPFWIDDTYKRTVILLIGRDRAGSTGIILNKQSNLSIDEALPQIAHKAPLFYGGPYNNKVVSFLHGNPQIPDSYYLGNDLYWGGNYDFILEMAANHQIRFNDFLFYAGFVEWMPNELEAELDEDKWWISELTRQELKEYPFQELWADKLIDDKHIYGLFNPIPDPSMN